MFERENAPSPGPVYDVGFIEPSSGTGCTSMRAMVQYLSNA